MMSQRQHILSGIYKQRHIIISYVVVFLYLQQPDEFEYYGNYVAKPNVRAAIHVGNLTYNSGTAVETHLTNDIMDTVKPWIATLMDNYKVWTNSSGECIMFISYLISQND
jgi:vitellogenic carboxypeptidase-like protein